MGQRSASPQVSKTLTGFCPKLPLANKFTKEKGGGYESQRKGKSAAEANRTASEVLSVLLELGRDGVVSVRCQDLLGS